MTKHAETCDLDEDCTCHVSRGIDFSIPGRAQPAGSKRAFVRGGRAHVVDANPKAGAWKERVAICARAAYDGPLIDRAVRLALTVTLARPAGHFTPKGALKGSARKFPSVKPDLTKYLRAVEDACTGIIWRDDAQVIQVDAVKVYGDSDVVHIHIDAFD